MSYHKNTIYETVIQCAYHKEYQSFISTNIAYVNDKKYNNFKMQRIVSNGKNLIVLFLDIPTMFNNKKYFVPISIFLQDNFPAKPPIIKVVLPGNNFIINNQNKDIEQMSCLITTDSMKKWDYTTSLNKLLDEMSSSFSSNFPIIQLGPGQVNPMANNNVNVNNGFINQNMNNANNNYNTNYNSNNINNQYISNMNNFMNFNADQNTINPNMNFNNFNNQMNNNTNNKNFFNQNGLSNSCPNYNISNPGNYYFLFLSILLYLSMKNFSVYLN